MSEDSDQDSDRDSFDSQATVVIEDDIFNPIRLLYSAELIDTTPDPKRRINRRMGIFEYEGKGVSAFYQSSGTSGSPLLKDTYLPFYGETKKLLKAIDINPLTQSKAWKIALKPHCNLSYKILNYFEEFYELQISASIDSPFWDRLSYREFVLSHEWNEITGEFELLPSPIPHSGNFSQMDCDTRIEMEKGEINKFLRTSGARIGERQIEAYLLQEQQEKEEAQRLSEMYELQQDQFKKEDIKEPPGSLKLDKGGKSLKKRKKSKKSKKGKKPNKHNTKKTKKCK
jgi:hypothetical protein